MSPEHGSFDKNLVEAAGQNRPIYYVNPDSYPYREEVDDWVRCDTHPQDYVKISEEQRNTGVVWVVSPVIDSLGRVRHRKLQAVFRHYYRIEVSQAAGYIDVCVIEDNDTPSIADTPIFNDIYVYDKTTKELEQITDEGVITKLRRIGGLVIIPTPNFPGCGLDCELVNYKDIKDYLKRFSEPK